MFLHSKITIRCGLILACILVIGTDTNAQPGSRRNRPLTTFDLLRLPEVVRELDLEKPQATLLILLQKDLIDQARSASAANENAGRDDDSPELDKTFDDLNDSGERLLSAVLTPKQWQRFRQIRLQYDGIAGILRPEIAEKLGLTRSQFEKLRIRLEVETTLAPDDPGSLELLTDTQRQKWLQMIGRRFRFESTPSARRRRGR